MAPHVFGLGEFGYPLVNNDYIVATNLIGERTVVTGGSVCGASEPALLAAATEAGSRVRAQLGLRNANGWPIE
jgi:hypothetical protein